MRKNLYVVIIIILALAASILTACGVVIMDDDIFGEYVFTNPPDKETVYDVDEGVVLDGKADEAFWQTEHNWYVGNFSDGSLGNVEIKRLITALHCACREDQPHEKPHGQRTEDHEIEQNHRKQRIAVVIAHIQLGFEFDVPDFHMSPLFIEILLL